MTEITDAQVREMLTEGQLRAVTFVDINGNRQFIYGLKPLARDLAESQKALGEIVKKRPHRYYEKTVNLFRDCPCCERMIKIARGARKGGKS